MCTFVRIHESILSGVACRHLASSGYHERTSVYAAKAVDAAEAVTADYTYHPLARASETGERRVGREEKGERVGRRECVVK